MPELEEQNIGESPQIESEQTAELSDTPRRRTITVMPHLSPPAVTQISHNMPTSDQANTSHSQVFEREESVSR